MVWLSARNFDFSRRTAIRLTMIWLVMCNCYLRLRKLLLGNFTFILTKAWQLIYASIAHRPLNLLIVNTRTRRMETIHARPIAHYSFVNYDNILLRLRLITRLSLINGATGIIQVNLAVGDKAGAWLLVAVTTRGIHRGRVIYSLLQYIMLEFGSQILFMATCLLLHFHCNRF